MVKTAEEWEKKSMTFLGFWNGLCLVMLLDLGNENKFQYTEHNKREDCVNIKSDHC